MFWILSKSIPIDAYSLFTAWIPACSIIESDIVFTVELICSNTAVLCASGICLIKSIFAVSSFSNWYSTANGLAIKLSKCSFSSVEMSFNS